MNKNGGRNYGKTSSISYAPTLNPYSSPQRNFLLSPFYIFWKLWQSYKDVGAYYIQHILHLGIPYLYYLLLNDYSAPAFIVISLCSHRNNCLIGFIMSTLPRNFSFKKLTNCLCFRSWVSKLGSENHICLSPSPCLFYFIILATWGLLETSLQVDLLIRTPNMSPLLPHTHTSSFSPKLPSAQIPSTLTKLSYTGGPGSKTVSSFVHHHIPAPTHWQESRASISQI